MTVDRKTWLNRETTSNVILENVLQTAWLDPLTGKISLRDNGGQKIIKGIDISTKKITYVNDELVII